METWGNTGILKLKKTAFLCSQKCPADIMLKSFDWAKEQRETGNCIVCGNRHFCGVNSLEFKTGEILVVRRKKE